MLCADVTVVGSYIDHHPVRKRGLERPVYDISRMFIMDAGRVAKTRKTAGVVRARIGGGVLSKTGSLFEYRDDHSALKEYTLLTSERLALRALSQNGLPPDMQIQWDRLVRGPMSPTLEQQVAYIKEDTDADGSTVTITAPDSGNLLVLCHGYYWRGTSPGEPTASANSQTFTRRGYAGTANFEVLQSILDRVANGSEGTSVVVTNGGTSQENSGGFLEYSGMTSDPFVAISAGADGGSGDVTSIGTGNVDTDTPNVADTLLIATFGTDGTSTSWGYTNSFSEILESQSSGGGSDHSTRIATRVVSAESATYNSTASWTTGVVAAGIVAAYAIEVATPPAITIPTGYLATNNLAARTISQMRTPTPDNISVAAGTSAITNMTLSCTLGKGVITMTGSGSCVVTGSGTNSLSLDGGSETDFNDTLATFAFLGLEPTHENVTIAVTATDGTLNDSENLVLFNHCTSLTVVADSYADLVASIQTFKVILHLGATSDTVTIVAEDEDTLTDEQVITLNLITLGSGFGVNQLMRRRRKKKIRN